MAKHPTPITVFTFSEALATELAARDPNSRALTGKPGNLSFHRLIAQHGAGEFTTLYAPRSTRHFWRTPVGGEVKFV